MRPMAYQRYKYTGNVYKFYGKEVGKTTVQQYYFANKINCSLNLKDISKLMLKASEPLSIGTIITDLTDANGDLVLDDMQFQVIGLQPVFNCFNTVEEYSMKLAKWTGTF
jgi:hypothetical protein